MTSIKILIFLVCTLFSTICLADEKLIFAVDVVRHGDRSPCSEIPKSPYHWKEGVGELTEKGRNQLSQLGAQFRERYIDQTHLLPENYDPASMYVRSTQVTRTIDSAHELLQGLYPNVSIQVNSVPKSQDNLLIVKPSSNIFSIIKMYIDKRKIWKEYTNSIQGKFKYWSEATGILINDFHSLNQLADILFVRQQHNIPYPEGITAEDADEIISLDEKLIINQFKHSEITYPMGQQLLSAIKNYFNAAKSKSTTLKYVLYSGHDGTIMAIMNRMGVPLDKTPSYASDLNFSLYKNDSQYYIKINFNNAPVKLAKCNNTNICSLDEFIRI